MAVYAEVAGAGPAVALVHEGIADSRMWDEQWTRWSQSFRLLRLDLRGFGRTPLDGGDLDAAVEASLRTWVDGPRRGPDEVDAGVRARVAEMQRDAYELQREWVDEDLLVPDLAERVGEIDVPVLVVIGEEDQPDMHAIAERLARELPGARLETIAGSAHVPSMERPREFDELVLPFLLEAA